MYKTNNTLIWLRFLFRFRQISNDREYHRRHERLREIRQEQARHAKPDYSKFHTVSPILDHRSRSAEFLNSNIDSVTHSEPRDTSENLPRHDGSFDWGQLDFKTERISHHDVAVKHPHNRDSTSYVGNEVVHNGGYTVADPFGRLQTTRDLPFYEKAKLLVAFVVILQCFFLLPHTLRSGSRLGMVLLFGAVIASDHVIGAIQSAYDAPIPRTVTTTKNAELDVMNS